MGLFSRKQKEQLTSKETAFKMANNVFKDLLLSDETIEHCINGKGNAENFIFSTGVLAVTNKRLLYYSQDMDKTKTENIMYNKIISIGQETGFDKKMGSYIGVGVELANGEKRIVRCLVNDENKDIIKELIFYVDSNR